MVKRTLKLLPLIFFLGGCSSAPLVAPPIARPSGPGIYHRVEKGETLWRISKTYNIDLEQLARINSISDASSIEIGQTVFIPGTKKERAILTGGSEEDFSWPLRGRVVCAFNQLSRNMVNKGVNIKPYDNREVAVSRSGKVVFLSTNFKAFGKTIIVDHQDGFSSVYSGPLEVYTKLGDYVRKHQAIARLGSGSGELHFEIRKGYVPQNPSFYLSY